jgi:hypothetical protein
MNKRRVTLNLDEDVVEALEAVGGRSMSSVANDALREALELAAHRLALREWLDEHDIATLAAAVPGTRIVTRDPGLPI